MAVPVLRTERLILRGWAGKDRVPFAELNADSEVMEHFPARLTRADCDSVKFSMIVSKLWAR